MDYYYSIYTIDLNRIILLLLKTFGVIKSEAGIHHEMFPL